MKKIIFYFLILTTYLAQSQNGFINAGPDVYTCDGSPVTLSSVGNTPSGLQLQIISGNGAASNLTDDSFSNAVNIGFTFNFYGNNYTQCLVSSNMYITFDLTNAGLYSPYVINSASPSPNNPINSIMSPWQDVNPNTSPSHIVRVGRFGTAPNRVFIVEWTNLVTFSCGGDCNSTQIILYEGSNIIETHIAEKSLCGTWNGGSAIHGLQNITGNIAHIVPGRNFPGQWTCFNDGQRFTPDTTNDYLISTIPFLPVPLGSTPNATYTWSVLGGAQISNGTTVTVSPSVTTSYVAALSNTSCNASFTYTDTVTVFVSNPPYAGTDTSIILCTKDTVNLFEFINNGPDTTGYWVPFLGNGYLGTFDPNIDTSGIYYYIVPGDTFCISDTSQVIVTVINTKLNLTQINDICENSECIDLIALPVGGVWSGPAINSNNKFCPTISGSGYFILTYTYTDAGCVFMSTTSVNVLPIPILLPIDHN